MDNNRRILLLVVFSISIGMLWNGWLTRNQPQSAPATTQNHSSVAANTSAGAATVLPQGGINSSAQTPASVPVASASNAPRVHVKTDVMDAEISAEGGSLVHLALPQHKLKEDKTQNFVLFDDGKTHLYSMQTGLLGDGMPNHKTLFSLPSEKEWVLADGANDLEIRLTAPESKGVQVAKVLTFHRGSYVVDVRYELTNKSEVPFNGEAYFQLVRDDKPAEVAEGFGGVTTFTGPAFYTDASKYSKVNFAAIKDNKAKIPANAEDGWVAMVQHYFVSAILPEDKTPRKFFAQRVSDDIYSAGVILPTKTVAPGQTVKAVETRLYAGPQEQAVLDKLAPGMPLVVDYGWLTLIASPLFLVISWLHKLTGNWGWAIILVTVLLKLLFFPLSAASYKSMAKMRALQPKMQQLKERYGDDKAKFQQEMMEFYKKEKINPLGGCWPILIQIPIFIALYWVLLGSVEMRQAPWIGWIQDLSLKDPYFVLPLIYGATMLIQTKLNPTPPDPVQAKVMLFMPIIFTFMFLWFPSGLVLYWVVNNILSIAQQWYITRMIEGSQGKSASA